MKILSTALDPQGVFIGVTRDGSLWVWVPLSQQWALYLQGEGKPDEPHSYN